jgi:amino acid adenylation domain-containing protein
VKDISMNQVKKRTLAAGQHIKERDYWLEKLSGRLVKTTFPYDFRKVDEKHMVSFTFKFSDPVYAKLLRISNKSDVRLHIILVTGWLLVLNRYTGAEDIIVGIPTYRQNVEGQLVNTALALRNMVTGEMTVKELLLQVGQSILKANENQNYPIESLIYKLNLLESDGAFPLFDISILLEELHDKTYLDHIRQNLVVSFRKSTASLEGVMEYNVNLYNETTMQRIVRHFCQLLENALLDVNIPVSQLEMLSQQELNQLLKDFNDNAADFPRDKSIFRFVEDQARKTPGAAAVSFQGHSHTYEQLNKRANRLAQILMAKGVSSDHTVGILMDRGSTMVESILAVWKAGGAYIPLARDYPFQRLMGILNDSDTGVLFADTHALGPQLYKKLKENYSGIIVDVTTTDPPLDNLEAGRGESGDENPDLDIPMYSLAYVIYTSGSTGKPKGAMVEHIGMMNHIQSKIDLLGISEESVAVQNASHTFDISVWQIFAALTRGGKTVIYPDALILDAVKFIHRLNEDRVSILEVVPSYLAVMLDAESAHDDVSLAGSMEYLLVTGEEIKPHLVARWFEMHPGIPMVNAYGPTEASDDITHHVMACAPDPNVERIPIGKPVQNLNIYIVDQYMKLCPIGAAGEIWVSGVGVGRGYLKDEERTARAFMDDPFGDEPGVRLYKTGDLGCWLADGSIEFLGRLDYQVKIRGFRIELGEIENCLVRHSLVKEAVVTDREDAEGNKYLCAYIIGTDAFKKDSGIETLKGYLNQILPDYMVPAYFVVLEQFPLTGNGKIDRKALPEPEVNAGGVIFITTEKLKRLQSEYFGSSKPSARSGAELKKDRRMAAINVSEMTIEEYARLEHYSVKTNETFYPLSHSQKTFYYIGETYGESFSKNNLYTVMYPYLIEPELLNEAINRVLFKYPGLRLRIVKLELDSLIQPAQYISQYKAYHLESFDFSTPGTGDRDADQQRWKVEKWARKKVNEAMPIIDSDLFYFAYLKYTPGESGYCIKLHHLIADNWTFYLVLKGIHREYLRLKKGEPMNDRPDSSFIDCLAYEKAYLTSDRMEEDRAFWHKTLLPLPPKLPISSRKGDPLNIATTSMHLSVPEELRARIHECSKAWKTSLFKLILSTLSLYLSRVTNQEDVVVGSVNHGRPTKLHRQAVGIFVGYFPMRIKIHHRMAFREFVEQNSRDVNYIVKNHTAYPFDVLLSELREITGQDVRYLADITLISHPDREKQAYTLHHYPSTFDAGRINIHVNINNTDIDGLLEIEWEYQLEYFRKEDIVCFHYGLFNILANALEDPGKPLYQLQMLSKEEKKRVLYEFNYTQAEFPTEKTIYRLFEEQVERTPDRIAVVGSGQGVAPPIIKGVGAQGAVTLPTVHISITYRELNEKSNRLARVLRARGITVHSIVGIMVERTIEMMIGMMAIIKAGGAYMAISLTYPDKRIEFMCRDSGMKLILTDNTRPLPNQPGLSIDALNKEYRQEDPGNLELVNISKDVAAVFYTSGSTGTPKGVLLEHQGMVNRMHWMHRRYPIDETDVILQKTAVVFDVSVWELFWWSFYGALVYLLPPGQGDRPQDIVDAVKNGGVTQMHFIPTPMAAFLYHVEETGQVKELISLKRIFASGEALPPALVNHFNRLLYQSNGTRLYNLYGPTEASIDVSYFDCPKDTDVEKIPIGKPIDNIRLYILGRSLELLPIGVAGELCIAGVGLARGYLNRPELTAERFDQDLWDYHDYRDEKKEDYQKFIRGFRGHSFQREPPDRRRLYRTGDLARWLPEGNIEFLGRIDHQVQINGIRIELEEVERVLLAHKDIKEAVVVASIDENGEPYLCAFVKAACDLAQSDFRRVLTRELPHYMIPGRFIELETLPLTPTGKVDRKLLKLIDMETKENRQVKYAAPRTELEIQIADIWKEVLHRDEVGIHDNFFDLGGNSLGIIQVNFKMKAVFEREIPALIMFEYSTIASMVRYLEKILDSDSAPVTSLVENQEYNHVEVKTRGRNRMQQRRTKIKKDRGQEE